MAENASGEQVTLGVMVDKERNKVLYAEAGKEFVDCLFSFLILPLGTIARLVAKESNIEGVNFGSISSLYHSVADLDQQYIWSQTCKEILLKPKSYMQCYCHNLKVNIDDTEPYLTYFRCEDKTCKIENRYCWSLLRNQKCVCAKLLNQEANLNWCVGKNGFVKESSNFIVSDDLYVMPNAAGTCLNLLQKLGVNNIDTIEKQTVHINKKDVVDILKLSLISKTPLSDFIFKKKKVVGSLDPRNRLEFWIGDVDKQSEEMIVKVVRRKSNEQILFIEAEEDFADFLFSFLTIPLGEVLHMLGGFSFLSCVDNLYKSVIQLSPDKYLWSEEVKDKLICPLLFGHYRLRNQILPIHKKKGNDEVYKHVDPKSPISGGFTRGPVTFMVTDNLVVTPTSSICGVSYLERNKVPVNDVEERVIKIGRNEGLRILKASLTTTSSLTYGLGLSIIEQFLLEKSA